jgi:prepilin-type N-terminal cleavage/methylation domain-containing protein
MMALQDRFRGGNSPGTGGISLRAQRGFSLMELMITLAIVLIMAGVTFYSLQPALKQASDTSAYDTTLMALRTYREKAIAQRQRYIVTFAAGAPATITISYWGIAVPVNPAPVVVQTLTLPPDIQFMVQGGMPNSPATTPDGFGSGITAIDFGQGLGLGNLTSVMFMPDGTSQDAMGLGNYNSGVIYMGRAAELQSMRAITVMGTTGRVRGWRLVQQAGGPTWVQQ